jgi:tetratricopeptide (TPR) repeat protein
LGDLSGAICDFSRSLELKPNLPVTWNNRGLAHHAQKNLDLAITDYTKAITMKPDFASAYANRSAAKIAFGNMKGAAADFKKAIALNPAIADDMNFTQFAAAIAANARGLFAPGTAD